jgi:hypothetical protein
MTEITCEALVARKAALEQGREQLLANLNATQGALQELDYWLKQLNDQPVEEEA